MHSKIPNPKWLTSHSKYKNICAGFGDSVARQTRGVRPTLNAGLRRWPTTEPAPTTLAGWAAQFYIIIHTEVGPFKAYQLSVDYLINLFTYYHDYILITVLKMS